MASIDAVQTSVWIKNFGDGDGRDDYNDADSYDHDDEKDHNLQCEDAFRCINDK